MKKTLKKKQRKVTKRSAFKPRGISKVVLLAVVAVVLAAAGGFYVLSQRSGNGASMGLPFAKKALNPKCKYNDPELCKFLNNYSAQTNYSVTSKSDYGGMSIESVYEISGEDKFHMVSKQNGKEISNMISIGDTTYTLDYSDNKWWKQTLKPEDPKAETEKEIKDQISFKEEETEDKTTYKFIAKEACADRNCFKYEVVSPDSDGSKMFIWFDDQDYLMRKMRVEDAKGTGMSESVYSYTAVSITAPSPVKEGTPNGYGVGMPQMNDAEMQKMMQQYQNSGYDTPSEDAEAPVDDSAPEEY